MIEVLVGMIASGKSTWAMNRAQEGWIIINDDSIVNAVHADDYLLYRKDLKPLYKSIESHILHTAVAMGENVVVDRGLSLSEHARRRWVALASSLDASIQAVLFEVFSPEVHAQRRFESDSRGHDYDYWLKVAQRHHSNYIVPTILEGFDIIEVRKWA